MTSYSRHFRLVALFILCTSHSLLHADDVSAPRQKACISVYRYGGAASGWIVNGPGAFPSGTLKSITAHVTRAQVVFTQSWVVAPQTGYSANVDWVWSGVVEDLADPYGNRNGDIEITEGAPSSDQNDRPVQDTSGGSSIVSPDLALILQYVADSQCYPVVFVNGLPGASGLTLVKMNNVSRTVFNNFNQAIQVVPTLTGVVTLIDSKSFPRTQNPLTFQKQSLISTLGHELGHAACLDPVVPQPDPKTNPRWGDATGHPPINQAATPTPEGQGVPGDGRTLYPDVMWYTGVNRTGEEFMTLRQAYLANMCVSNVNGVRETYAPSFTVVPNGPTALLSYVIYGGPAAPPAQARPPVSIGLGNMSSIDAFSYDQTQFPKGRVPYKFTVDKTSIGLVGSSVNMVVAALNNPAGYEFSSPADPAGSILKTNSIVLSPVDFGLAALDNLAALTFRPPSFIDPLGAGLINPGKKVYFSVPPNDPSGLDPADIGQVLGTNTGPAFSIYATKELLGLQKGDDIDGLCVADNGNGLYDGPPLDTVLFSLTRNSTSVTNGTFSAADILLGPAINANGPVGPPIVVRPAKSLGLAAGDDLKGLKCFVVKACDINGDGKVNLADIQLIIDARNTKTFQGDPRDVDGDGIITANDARICTLRCDNAGCK
jgi:Dockerin type I domain